VSTPDRKEFKILREKIGEKMTNPEPPDPDEKDAIELCEHFRDSPPRPRPPKDRPPHHRKLRESENPKLL